MRALSLSAARIAPKPAEAAAEEEEEEEDDEDEDDDAPAVSGRDIVAAANAATEKRGAATAAFGLPTLSRTSPFSPTLLLQTALKAARAGAAGCRRRTRMWKLL